MRRRVAVLLMVCAAVGSGCSSGQPSDELMVTDDPVAARAAVSPPAAVAPAGAVTPLDGPVTALAFDPAGRTLVAGTAAAVHLFHLEDGVLTETGRLDQDAPVESATVDGDTVLVTAGGVTTRVDPVSGEATWTHTFEGSPSSATAHDGDTLVALRDEQAVAVVRDDQVRRVISGNLMSADQVLSTGDGAVVLDRLRNAVFELDVAGGDLSQGLRAGKGATNAVTDRFGRVLVTDTRGGALLAFSLDPLLLRQNYPVPGAPYGIAYDRERDIAWVTLTETNEVAGYEVAGEEPKEKYRFPTVSQPNTVTVDPKTGSVVVASGTGEGIQVISV